MFKLFGLAISDIEEKMVEDNSVAIIFKTSLGPKDKVWVKCHLNGLALIFQKFSMIIWF